MGSTNISSVNFNASGYSITQISNLGPPPSAPSASAASQTVASTPAVIIGGNTILNQTSAGYASFDPSTSIASHQFAVDPEWIESASDVQAAPVVVSNVAEHTSVSLAGDDKQFNLGNLAADVNFWGSGSEIDVNGQVTSLVVGAAADQINVAGSVGRLDTSQGDQTNLFGEVTSLDAEGGGQQLNISGAVGTLFESGQNNQVNISGTVASADFEDLGNTGVSDNQINVTGSVTTLNAEALGDQINISGTVANVQLSGIGNQVNVSGQAGELDIAGSGNDVNITGTAQTVNVSGSGETVTVAADFNGQINITGTGDTIVVLPGNSQTPTNALPQISAQDAQSIGNQKNALAKVTQANADAEAQASGEKFDLQVTSGQIPRATPIVVDNSTLASSSSRDTQGQDAIATLNSDDPATTAKRAAALTKANASSRASLAYGRLALQLVTSAETKGESRSTIA